MYITKEKFEEICKKYSSLLVVEGDVSEAFNFVHDLLSAEADALEAKEPYALNTIQKLNSAAYQVFEIGLEVENEEFLKQEGELPKCVSVTASDLAANYEDVFRNYAVLGDEALADIVGDYLSDTYGYCHFGFAMEVKHNEFGAPSEVIVTDIQWDVDQEQAIEDVLENANGRAGGERSGASLCMDSELGTRIL